MKIKDNMIFGNDRTTMGRIEGRRVVMFRQFTNATMEAIEKELGNQPFFQLQGLVPSDEPAHKRLARYLCQNKIR